MRLSSFALFLGASTLGAAERNSAADVDADTDVETTTFNGQEVPPLLEVTPDNIDEVKNGTKNVVVKYYRYDPSHSIEPISPLTAC